MGGKIRKGVKFRNRNVKFACVNEMFAILLSLQRIKGKSLKKMKLSAKQKWAKEARKFFSDIVKIYEIDEKHQATFYGAVECLNNFHKSTMEIEKNGMTYKTASGQIKKNPACQIQKDSWSGFLMGLKALGLYEYQSKGRPPGR